jgi:hypothetical protein
MSTLFTAWCDTCEDGGPEVQRTAGGSSLIDPAAWSAWLIEHGHHDLSLVVENSHPFGLPWIQVNRGGIQFQVRVQDAVAADAAWSAYRKEYGTSVSKEDRVAERQAFLAGWAAKTTDKEHTD